MFNHTVDLTETMRLLLKKKLLLSHFNRIYFTRNSSLNEREENQNPNSATNGLKTLQRKVYTSELTFHETKQFQVFIIARLIGRKCSRRAKPLLPVDTHQRCQVLLVHIQQVT